LENELQDDALKIVITVSTVVRNSELTVDSAMPVAGKQRFATSVLHEFCVL